MTEDDQTRLAAIQAREQAATAGPWGYDGISYTVPPFQHMLRADGSGTTPADAEFIAHARSDIPYLLAALARLQAENTDLKAEKLSLHRLWLDADNGRKQSEIEGVRLQAERDEAQELLQRATEQRAALRDELIAAEAARDDAIVKATYEIGAMNEVLLASERARDEAQRQTAALRAALEFVMENSGDPVMERVAATALAAGTETP